MERTYALRSICIFYLIQKDFWRTYRTVVVWSPVPVQDSTVNQQWHTRQNDLATQEKRRIVFDPPDSLVAAVKNSYLLFLLGLNFWAGTSDRFNNFGSQSQRPLERWSGPAAGGVRQTCPPRVAPASADVETSSKVDTPVKTAATRSLNRLLDRLQYCIPRNFCQRKRFTYVSLDRSAFDHTGA